MTDAESPTPVEDVSASLPSTQVSLRVTFDGGHNAQLYIYHLEQGVRNDKPAESVLEGCVYCIS